MVLSHRLWVWESIPPTAASSHWDNTGQPLTKLVFIVWIFPSSGHQDLCQRAVMRLRRQLFIHSLAHSKDGVTKAEWVE